MAGVRISSNDLGNHVHNFPHEAILYVVPRTAAVYHWLHDLADLLGRPGVEAIDKCNLAAAASVRNMQ